MSTKQDVIEALRAIEDAEGRLTPEAIVKAARPKGSPLHDRFEWDDRKAGHAFRLIQAQKLMTIRLRITEERQSYSVPMYVHDPELPPDQQGYRNVMRVRREPELAHEVLSAEMVRIAGNLRRARELAAVLGLADQIVEIEGKVEKFVASLKATPEMSAEAA